MHKKVVGITGPPGAGKTEVARVAQQLGFGYIRMGDVVIEEVRRRGLAVTEENVGKVANELRKSGADAIARLCLPKARRMEKVVIDGIRGVSEVELFRREFGNSFKLIAVWARQGTRFRRVCGRGREDDARDWERFLQKDMRELGWGLGGAMLAADFLIVNEGSLEELKRNAESILRTAWRF